MADSQNQLFVTSQSDDNNTFQKMCMKSENTWAYSVEEERKEKRRQQRKN
jgi:hypothetical protein